MTVRPEVRNYLLLSTLGAVLVNLVVAWLLFNTSVGRDAFCLKGRRADLFP